MRMQREVLAGRVRCPELVTSGRGGEKNRRKEKHKNIKKNSEHPLMSHTVLSISYVLFVSSPLWE